MGQPWSKFFWSDWRSDPGLRASSLAARGLWIDMLCIAAEADPTGYVLVNGRTPTTTDLARMTGAPEAEVQSSLEELERNGVFSRDRKGRIYSRRMVRDDKRRKTAQQNGEKGGNPSLRKISDISASDNPEDKGSLNTQKPEAKKPEELSSRDARGIAVAKRCLELIGKVSDPSWNGGVVWQWLADGADPERDIYPTIARIWGGSKRPSIRSLAYFTPAIAETVARRKAEERRESSPDVLRRLHEKHFAETGEWLPGWGQRPTRDVA